jgi:hypothetical protein
MNVFGEQIDDEGAPYNYNMLLKSLAPTESNEYFDNTVEMGILRKVFSEEDTNSDGKISLSQLETILANLGLLSPTDLKLFIYLLTVGERQPSEYLHMCHIEANRRKIYF